MVSAVWAQTAPDDRPESVEGEPEESDQLPPLEPELVLE